MRYTKTMVSMICLVLFAHASAFGQAFSSSLPTRLVKNGNYLFYLHGGVVTNHGNNAINESVPEWGPYEYHNILDSLHNRGFYIVSERRWPGIEDSVYVNKISKQIDTLIHAGIQPERIVVVGASAGAAITLHVSAKMKHPKMNYVIIGGCWPEEYKDYADEKLCGRFLSIIESTDPHGTCLCIFEGRKEISSYQEVTLHMGLSHGFIYRGYKEWIDPIVNWFYKRR